MQHGNASLSSSIDHVVNDCRLELTNKGSMFVDERFTISHPSPDGILGCYLCLLHGVMGPVHMLMHQKAAGPFV